MLISYEQSQRVIDLPVGVAVCRWELDDKARMWVLYPYSDGTVDIDFAAEEYGHITVVGKETKQWGSHQYGYGDNEIGYPFNQDIAHDIYTLWDGDCDYAMSKRIYNQFESVFQYYGSAANSYLKQLAKNEHDEVVTVANTRGWDKNLITDTTLTFPYHA